MTILNGIYYEDTGEAVIDFDTYIENSYHNSNGVAYEPLEDGTFSSDSKQDSPFMVSLTLIKNIQPNLGGVTSLDSLKLSVNIVKNNLEALAQGDDLVKIVLQPMLTQVQKSSDSQYYQYGQVYDNMTLVSIDYQNTPDQLEFRPVLLFQQIRITNTEYTDTQNTANSDDSSTVNQGQVQPTTTSPSFWESLKTNSVLNSAFGG